MSLNGLPGEKTAYDVAPQFSGIKVVNQTRKEEAASRFYEALFIAGASLLESEYKSAIYRHLIKCIEGHVVKCSPNAVQQGHPVCNACSGRNSKYAFFNFKKAVESHGGSVLEEAWLGNSKKHKVQCAKGHVIYPTPANASQGHHFCEPCAYQLRNPLHSIFYVVENTKARVVKFGISSESGESARLNKHRADGFDSLVRLFRELPEGFAPGLETDVKNTLFLAKEAPCRGREYFNSSCIGLILDIVDSSTKGMK